MCEALVSVLSGRKGGEKERMKERRERDREGLPLKLYFKDWQDGSVGRRWRHLLSNLPI